VAVAKFYTEVEALSQCVPCLQQERQKFCTNGTHYQCCKTYEKGGICDSLAKDVSCSSDNTHEVQF